MQIVIHLVGITMLVPNAKKKSVATFGSIYS